MNQEEAEKKAKEIWGKDGFAVCNYEHMSLRIFDPQCKVGFVSNGHMIEVKGAGTTWELAFKDAKYNSN